MFFFSERRRRERRAAEAIYSAASAASRNPALFGRYGVPDTFEGRMEMVMLHLFPIIHRLLPAHADPALARLVSEVFIEDTDAALREMGVGDLTVPKRMKKLYSAFAGRMSAYSGAAASGEEALVEAIRRNVYPADAPEPCVRAMAQYLEGLLATCHSTSLDALREGRVVFPEPAGELPVEGRLASEERTVS